MIDISPFVDSAVIVSVPLKEWISAHDAEIQQAISTLRSSSEPRDGVLLASAPFGFAIAKVFIFRGNPHPVEFHPNSEQVSGIFSGQMHFRLERPIPFGGARERRVQSFADQREAFVCIKPGVVHRPVVTNDPVFGIVFHTDPEVATNSIFGEDFEEVHRAVTCLQSNNF
jgi:hypothetical protein